MRSLFLFTGASLMIAASVPALGTDEGAQKAQGAVELSNGTKVLQNSKLPKLDLTNQQREQIRKSVLSQHSDVEFQLKSTKSAKNFRPQVGAKLPKGVKGHSLPPAVLSQMPQLRNYKYVALKDQVLIVNAMTKKIVDVFPETKPIT
jgi:hypothetical protein